MFIILKYFWQFNFKEQNVWVFSIGVNWVGKIEIIFFSNCLVFTLKLNAKKRTNKKRDKNNRFWFVVPSFQDRVIFNFEVWEVYLKNEKKNVNGKKCAVRGPVKFKHVSFGYLDTWSMDTLK